MFPNRETQGDYAAHPSNRPRRRIYSAVLRAESQRTSNQASRRGKRPSGPIFTLHRDDATDETLCLPAPRLLFGNYSFLGFRLLRNMKIYVTERVR